MKESDIKHLKWMHDRLTNFHTNHEAVCTEGFNPDGDFISKFKSIIDELEKENMPKEKRYRLEIPEEVPKDMLTTALKLIEHDNRTLNEYRWGLILKETAHPKTVYKSWLKETKEQESVTAEESVKQRYNIHRLPAEYQRFYKIGFGEGEKNNELKHQETEDCEDWITWYEWHIKKITDKEQAREIWKAANKSRGMNEAF